MIKQEKRMQIKNFKIVLKDMEPMVRNPKFLQNGRNIQNFSLRPREAWANWLLCVVLRELHGEEITFSEDKKGDGIIVDKKTRQWISVEHVSALDNPSGKALPKSEDRIIEAIDHKIKRGPDYAKNKNLVVFFDGAVKVYINKVRENIAGRHNFNLVYCIGLLSIDGNGYSYAVTEFHEKYSLTFKVQINSSFTDWKVTQIKK